jgi:diaminohydroxyphosphoribosylaminopyrimidine deaminase / 5-amino-6-(5-phosphoribosylamino)uracil reductase
VRSTTAVARDAAPALGEDSAWCLLQALALLDSPFIDGTHVALDERGAVRSATAERGLLTLGRDYEHGFRALVALSPAARELLELYVPLCVAQDASGQFVLAHLGQSLDGRIATVSGASRFVTGPEDLRHMHRLRALFDVVMVGAETARADNPQLTTRLVPGRQPVRVVLDPRARLDRELKLFRDGCAPTLIVHAEEHAPRARFADHVEHVSVACDAGKLRLDVLLAALRARGLRRIFIEGGGVTVSHFLEAGLLDRLQLTVAPMIIGSGISALTLTPISRIADAITAQCRRFALGADMLFDCDLRAEPV